MSENNKQILVYVASPFNGIQSNLQNHYRWLEELTEMNKDNGYTFVSGLAQYNHMYDSMGYADGLKLCLDLLSQCDVLLLDCCWETSKGCVAEWAYCLDKDIQIVDTMNDLLDFNGEIQSVRIDKHYKPLVFRKAFTANTKME